MTKRVALVTGGTGGLGTAICRRLADTGHQVIAADIGTERDVVAEWASEQQNADYYFPLLEADVSSFESCRAMVERAEQEVGPIDVLVNCAGITRDGVLKKMNYEQWQAVINVNLNSVFNVTKQVVEGMLERKFGRIINISSVNGQKGQFGQTNYSAAKAGMHGFTMALAQEVARKGVTVNTISPGYMATKMVMAIDEEIRNQIIAGIPVGRLGKPEEIAAMAAFLASDDAGFITGANFDVNGGLHMQ